MLASEYIKALQTLVERHGDIPVCIEGGALNTYDYIQADAPRVGLVSGSGASVDRTVVMVAHVGAEREPCCLGSCDGYDLAERLPPRLPGRRRFTRGPDRVRFTRPSALPEDV